MKILKFENFINEKLTKEQYLLKVEELQNYYNSLPIPQKFTKSKIKEVLYHGTNTDPSTFELSNDFERTTSVYDFDLPDGFVFLTNSLAEAKCYGQFAIPVRILSRKVMTFKVNNNAPSREFDDDFNDIRGFMFSKFVNSSCDVLEIKGYEKSTFLTYPELVFPVDNEGVRF